MSASTKLPTPSGSVGTWGAELNDFLGQSMVASTTAGATNGLLKKDHAAITDGGKVGIGTNAPIALLEVKSQGLSVNTSVIGGQTLFLGTSDVSIFNLGANEDTIISGGKATSIIKIGETVAKVNIATGGASVNIGSELVKLGIPDILLSVKGSATEAGQARIQGEFPSLSFADAFATSHIATNNTGSLAFYTGSPNSKLNASTETSKLFIAIDGKIGIGTSSPTQKLEVQGNIKVNVMVDYPTTAAALADAALLAGTMYTVTTAGVKAVYIK